MNNKKTTKINRFNYREEKSKKEEREKNEFVVGLVDR